MANVYPNEFADLLRQMIASAMTDGEYGECVSEALLDKAQQLLDRYDGPAVLESYTVSATWQTPPHVHPRITITLLTNPAGAIGMPKGEPHHLYRIRDESTGWSMPLSQAAMLPLCYALADACEYFRAAMGPWYRAMRSELDRSLASHPPTEGRRPQNEGRPHPEA